MKATQLLPLLLSALITATSSFAQDTAPEKKPERPSQRQSRDAGPGKTKGGGESRLLLHLLEMDDAQLASIRQTVERIEKMPPEERQKMRERIGKMRDMPPEKVEAMREKFKAIPQEQREAMRERWMSMTHEERNEWRDKLKRMSREDRNAVFEEQGFLAPPTIRDKNGSRAQNGKDSKKQHQRGPKPDPTEEIEEN
ncbi:MULTISPECIES: DUF3106 domain-containing protein [unclassified Lentimonas]|uniref:DUF3106 domain-containing protein n=1 Tax=unclassified Lentimonas TaxID=2630993 RepID=UPI00132081DA|nr:MULTISPECIES: DUF3106 domain-containing protein [unclassified Lentimonas]CAA6677896.1 Unannotated [Lentimonas sp. CC4]CAA6684000.1 Unannotated [Lentimonas sp. CC6]CAA6689892.1 Unannotated [Lentimonas sp. CC10]CAA6697140.1 Unannotated [Lentimonas sp. CC19]CAA7069414.1 Unannotated [Lentimonas sp. CC11]